MSRKPEILVVDDEEGLGRSFCGILAGAQCNVETACGGAQALRAMEGRSYDVVLLDLKLPETNGLGVLKAIKERWPECEVVVITGHPSLEMAKDSMRLGAYDYLAKPLGADQVIRAAHGAARSKQWSLHRDRPACRSPAPRLCEAVAAAS